jgi:hypothetical protein
VRIGMPYLVLVTSKSNTKFDSAPPPLFRS